MGRIIASRLMSAIDHARAGWLALALPARPHGHFFLRPARVARCPLKNHDSGRRRARLAGTRASGSRASELMQCETSDGGRPPAPILHVAHLFRERAGKIRLRPICRLRRRRRPARSDAPARQRPAESTESSSRIASASAARSRRAPHDAGQIQIGSTFSPPPPARMITIIMIMRKLALIRPPLR